MQPFKQKAFLTNHGYLFVFVFGFVNESVEVFCALGTNLQGEFFLPCLELNKFFRVIFVLDGNLITFVEVKELGELILVLISCAVIKAGSFADAKFFDIVFWLGRIKVQTVGLDVGYSFVNVDEIVFTHRNAQNLLFSALFTSSQE